jgi:hypothetical protein
VRRDLQRLSEEPTESTVVSALQPALSEFLKGNIADIKLLRVELFKHYYADQNQFGLNHDISPAEVIESLITICLS